MLHSSLLNIMDINTFISAMPHFQEEFARRTCSHTFMQGKLLSMRTIKRVSNFLIVCLYFSFYYNDNNYDIYFPKYT